MSPMRVLTWSAAGWFSLAAIAAPISPAAKTETPATPYRTIAEALREGKTTEDRAQILADLAWPAEVDNPELSAMARGFLVDYGKEGLRTLRSMIRRVVPRYQADVTAALLEARLLITWGQPEEYLPAMEEAIWFGTIDAKRLAIVEVTRYKFDPALLTAIDAAFEYPELTELVIIALGEFQNDKARHFLLEIVRTGSTRNRMLAAQALAQIGDRARLSLRDAALDEDRAVRTIAMRMLIPATDPDDLATLHDFLGRYGDDEDVIVSLVRSRVAQIEEFLDSIQRPQN